MTLLASGASGLLTVQCDVCCPPFLATNTAEQLRENGWLLAADGAAIDLCHLCRRRLSPAAWTPRSARPELAEDRGGAWPNFFIIGAAKCATTTLHAHLGRHPDVHMAEGKELQFFNDPHGELWAAHYRAQFDASATIRGESSTVYTRAPAVPGVAERMAARCPDARLVYLVRDPVERALSSYVEERMHSNDTREPGVAFADPSDPDNPYVAASRYARQLELYLAHFPADRIRVLDMAELVGEPDRVVREIWGWLDLDPALGRVEVAERLNTRDDKREYPSVVRRLRSASALRLVYRLPPGVREALLAPVRQRLSRRIPRPEIPAQLRAALVETLAPDTARLRELTGSDFVGWTV